MQEGNQVPIPRSSGKVKTSNYSSPLIIASIIEFVLISFIYFSMVVRVSSLFSDLGQKQDTLPTNSFVGLVVFFSLIQIIYGFILKNKKEYSSIFNNNLGLILLILGILLFFGVLIPLVSSVISPIYSLT